LVNRANKPPSPVSFKPSGPRPINQLPYQLVGLHGVRVKVRTMVLDLRRFSIVVNSDYRTHSSDNPSGWAPLDPATVGAPQYTDREPHGGYNIDMNAF
jgi:hypothetical protein